MKQIMREVVNKNKFGRVVITNHSLEPHERDTIFCLASFGLSTETIIPSHTLHSDNPDLTMLGTTWEIKGPITNNKKTLTTEFRKAVKQSGGRAIFDLHRVKSSSAEVEKHLLELFVATRGAKRLMIIRKNGKILLDMSK